MKILVVEDDMDLLSCLEDLISTQGHEVKCISQGSEVSLALQEFCPDFILLDQNLPGRTGVEVLKEIRTDVRYQDLPVIMITGLSAEDSMLNAFDVGADDYITKPFRPRVLMKRIDAVARRYGIISDQRERYKKDELTLDVSSHKVTIGGKELSLTLTEFKILRELFKEAGRIVTREVLLERALGSINVTNRTIDVHMCSLRKKLESHGRTIQTVRGVGYRLAS